MNKLLICKLPLLLLLRGCVCRGLCSLRLPGTALHMTTRDPCASLQDKLRVLVVQVQVLKVQSEDVETWQSAVFFASTHSWQCLQSLFAHAVYFIDLRS